MRVRRRGDDARARRRLQPVEQKIGHDEIGHVVESRRSSPARLASPARVLNSAPALLISTSICGSLAAISAADALHFARARQIADSARRDRTAAIRTSEMLQRLLGALADRAR